MKLSDGSELGISAETIALPGHTLGVCPKGLIWFKVIRSVTTCEYHLPEMRQYWTQVPLPQDVEEVKQYLALVRRKENRINWMFLYLSELTPLHITWFTPQDWDHIRIWLSSTRITQGLRHTLELCRRQHEMNLKVPDSLPDIGDSEEFLDSLRGPQPDVATGDISTSARL